MFALLSNNIVWQLFDTKPDFHPGAPIIDVSNVPGVAEGWIVGADGSVTAPPQVAPNYTAESLTTYAALVRAEKIEAGITINVAPEGATPINLSVDTSASGRTNILGLESLAAKGGTITWVQKTGAVTLTQAQLDLVALTTGNYVSAVYATWGEIVAGIQATPQTYANPDDINNAKWPSQTY